MSVRTIIISIRTYKYDSPLIIIGYPVTVGVVFKPDVIRVLSGRESHIIRQRNILCIIVLPKMQDIASLGSIIVEFVDIQIQGSLLSTKNGRG